MKDVLAKMIASRMTEEQKRQMIQAFYDTHKQDKNIEELIVGIKNSLNYHKDDVPKR